MLEILLSSVLVAFTSPLQSEWVKVAENTTGTIWRVRASDILNITNKWPKVWITLDHSADKTKAERETKELIAFNCDARSYQTLAVITYRANGTVINNSESQPNQYSYSYAPPDSVIETALIAVCPQ